MAWITVRIAQNGNTTRRYSMNGFTGMTTFDSVAAGPEVGSSGAQVTDHESFVGPRHVVAVEVVGAAASQFRIRGGLQS